MATFMLIGGEQVIVGADGPLCLTTHRVRFEGRRVGSQSVDEIFLEDVSYKAIRMSSRPLYLALAGFLALFSVSVALASSGSGPELAIIGILGAIAFAIAYVVTRRQVLVLASSGGRIELAASSMPRETLDWFLLKLAEAKDHRIRSLSSMGGRTAAVAA